MTGVSGTYVGRGAACVTGVSLEESERSNSRSRRKLPTTAPLAAFNLPHFDSFTTFQIVLLVNDTILKQKHHAMF